MGESRGSLPDGDEVATRKCRGRLSSSLAKLGHALLQQGRIPEARAELLRADKLQPEMPETLYSLGKAASLSVDNTSAEKAWLKVVEIEKESDLAAQAHFALAVLYRKQGKTENAEQEMAKFKQLQHTPATSEVPQK